MTIDLAHPKPADLRGWGSGWPDCQVAKQVPLDYAGFSAAHIRAEVHDLLIRLLDETQARGYTLHEGWCWAFSCRAIKRPDGTLSDTPSNHSWGLAVDLNAPKNPNQVWTGGPLVSDMPGWMPKLWNSYGFRWGGDYPKLGGRTADAMHYEFTGTRLDAQDMTEKAEQEGLGIVLSKRDQQALEDWKAFRDKLLENLGRVDNPNQPATPAGAGTRVARATKASEK